ncbi:MAG: S-methyl-5'-thioadenosine phosphorylase, partial [Hadesarchaea archaeon]|nr:S-methyl-5'-thioadenosine phosphorylase [Hadesarchaea archaeon]
MRASRGGVRVGIIGGTGLYRLAVSGGWRGVRTPYGRVEVLVGGFGPGRVAFLPRHGRKHEHPPHLVNYRANLWALRSLGVERVLAVSACGSLNPRMRPGELVLLDQFLDFTRSRPATFYTGGRKRVVHVDLTEPYCPELRRILLEAAKEEGVRLHPRGTYVCTEGPRFETAAEIRAFRRLGGDLVGMTNVPECVLARELEMCYAAVGLVTNFAAGLAGTKLTHTEVAERMERGT